MTFEFYENPKVRTSLDRPVDPQASAFHRMMDNYYPTPLYALPEVAKLLGVAQVYLKDESNRLGLPSFKMLGASWAVSFAVRTHWLAGETRVMSPSQLSEMIEDKSSKRLVAATDGNHGRGVARMARLLGVSSTIFVPRGVASERVRAIENEGAEVVIVDGTYDEAIAMSAGQASGTSIVVSDTSWEGYREIPEQVTIGYATLFREIDDQLLSGGMNSPSTISLQAGVGSFAAAGLLHYKGEHEGADRVMSIVEPRDANCLMESARTGELAEVPGPHSSRMDGLNCGRPSELTWPIIRDAADIFIGIEDEAAYEAMVLLSEMGVVSGESGAAGLGGLLAVGRDGTAEQRSRLGLKSDASILVVNTEGATDPENYARVTGKTDSWVTEHAAELRAGAGVISL